MKPVYNKAQILLGNIGGTAALVAGIDGHYWADSSTPKKAHKRPRVGRGSYGRNLKDHFDQASEMVRKYGENSGFGHLRLLHHGE